MASETPVEQLVSNPYCQGMKEHPDAAAERAKLCAPGVSFLPTASDPLVLHLSLGLAYTVGSALSSRPPSTEACLAAFVVPNSVGLTAGARAWSKHGHRSQTPTDPASNEPKAKPFMGWWGTPSGPVATINEKALALFWKVVHNATWRNLHWLPHQILVYEVRVAEGYGMRWSQDRSVVHENEDEMPLWLFRGFVEPMMEGGHEVGWRH